mgnify:FL=1
MKKIISIFAMSLLLSANVYADNNKDTADSLDQQKAEVTENKSDVSGTVVNDSFNSDSTSDKREEAVAADSIDTLSLISLIISVIALGVGVFAFILSNRKCTNLKGRYNKVDADLTGLNQRLDQKLRDARTENVKKLEQLKSDILEDVSFLIRKQEESKKIVTSTIKAVEEPIFTPKTLYGVFKTRLNGVHSDQMTEVQEATSTLMISTKSENTASVSLVRNLDKVQFGNLNENAVEVLDGNPLSYDSIIEVEAGLMRLDDDIWVLEKKIKVKLS